MGAVVADSLALSLPTTLIAGTAALVTAALPGPWLKSAGVVAVSGLSLLVGGFSAPYLSRLLNTLPGLPESGAMYLDLYQGGLLLGALAGLTGSLAGCLGCHPVAVGLCTALPATAVAARAALSNHS